MNGEFLWQFITEVKNKTKKMKMFQLDSSRSLFTSPFQLLRRQTFRGSKLRSSSLRGAMVFLIAIGEWKNKMFGTNYKAVSWECVYCYAGETRDMLICQQ